MGYTYVEGEVTGPTSTRLPIKFLVDTGALLTLLPEPVWRAIGLEPKRTRKFVLADGTVIERKISYCTLKLGEFGEYPTPVVLGEANDQPLLGVVSLEAFGVTVDPTTGALHEMDVLFLMSVA
jgi:predicted aspartyl protease